MKKTSFFLSTLGVILIVMSVSSCGQTTSLPTMSPAEILPSSTQAPTTTPAPSFTPIPSATSTPLTDLHLLINTEDAQVKGGETIPLADLGALTDSLPKEWIATQQDLARYELRMVPFGTITDACRYEPSPGAQTLTPAVMTLLKVDVEATITDTKNNKVLDRKRFEGYEPGKGSCPGTISSSGIISGLPSESQFKHWVLVTMLANTDMPVPVMGVSGLSYSPDGKYLAYGSEDFTVKILDMSAGNISQVLTGHIDEVKNVLYSPDGKTLVSASLDGTANVWDLASGLELDSHPAYKPDPALFFSVDGKILVVRKAIDEYIFWETSRNNKALAQVFGNALALSPTDMTLARDFGGMQLSLFDILPFRYTTDADLRNHSTDLAIDLIVFSPDGKTLAIWGENTAAGGRDHWVKLIDAESMQEILMLEKPVFVRRMIFSPDGKLLATQTATEKEASITLWDTAGGKELQTLRDPSFTSMVFSPDGKNLITGSRSGVIQIWDVGTGNLLSEIRNTFFMP